MEVGRARRVHDIHFRGQNPGDPGEGGGGYAQPCQAVAASRVIESV